MDEEGIKRLIKEVVVEINRAHKCPLVDAGISNEEHKDHHKQWKVFLADAKRLKGAFLVGFATAIGGGVFALLAMGLFEKLKGG